MGLDANKSLEPPGVPVKTTSIAALKKECGLKDAYRYQHDVLRDITNKK